MIAQIILPLITLFADPECGRQADWAESIIRVRERGLAQEVLTAIPIVALANGQIELDDAIAAVESIRTIWAWRESAWEVRIVAYERCVGENLAE